MDRILVFNVSFHVLYSRNENTMRGAAKSLATPLGPAAFVMNVIGVSEIVYASIPQFNSRYQGDFLLSS